MKTLIFLYLFGIAEGLAGDRKTRVNAAGRLEAVGFEVKFRVPLINIARGFDRAELGDMNPVYANMIGFFENLRAKHGPFKLIKQAPDYEWGDTLKPTVTDGKLVRVIDLSQLYYVYFGRFIEIEPIINQVRRFDEVEYAHPPAEAISLSDPDDPDYQSGEQWDLAIIEASKAWAITKGTANIRVAIIEVRGVPDHLDLNQKFVPGTGDGPGGAQDNHGLKVAGIAAASTDNSTDVASLGWNLSLTRYHFGEDTTLIAGKIDDARGTRESRN